MVKDLDPLKGVSVRGVKADHVKALLRGNFDDCALAGEALGHSRRLGELYFNGRLPEWLRRKLNAGLCTPLVKKSAPAGVTPDARPVCSEDCDMKVWRRCLVKQSTPAFKEQVAPQQLSVGISGGCEIKILGAQLEFERQRRLGAGYAHVALDMRNAHNQFDRRKAQAALDGMAEKNGSLAALAQGAWADTCFPTDVYTRGSDNGFRLLKSFDVGGAQGSPLSPIIFPAAIDGAMKATEAKYPGVKLTAIQDDIDPVDQGAGVCLHRHRFY